MTFGPWIADHVARRPRLEPGDVEAAAALGALQSLRSGVGTIADASFAGASVRAASEAGLRGIVDFEGGLGSVGIGSVRERDCGGAARRAMGMSNP